MLQLYENYACSCGKTHSAGVDSVIIEKGAVLKLIDYANKYGVKKAFIVCDKNTYQFAKIVIDSLDKKLENYIILESEGELADKVKSFDKYLTEQRIIADFKGAKTALENVIRDKNLMAYALIKPLADERARYEKEQIVIRHLPIDKPYKIGVAHPFGAVRYERNGVAFEKTYKIDRDALYPDGGVSYETFFCMHMAEIESLSPVYNVAPADSAEHQETWKLYHV